MPGTAVTVVPLLLTAVFVQYRPLEDAEGFEAAESEARIALHGALSQPLEHEGHGYWRDGAWITIPGATIGTGR